jgi:hypothetical protein
LGVYSVAPLLAEAELMVAATGGVAALASALVHPGRTQPSALSEEVWRI